MKNQVRRSFLAALFLIVLSGLGTAMMTVSDTGLWPDSWPKEHPMKTILSLILLAALLGGAGCSTPSYMGKHPPCYEFTTQVLAMRSCRATMEFVSPCKRRFKTTGGAEFYIGSPGADRELMQFVGTLEEGKYYYLPRAFMAYLEEQKQE